MTLLQSLGDNQIQRAPDRFAGRMTEDSFRAGIPVADFALAVCSNDGIAAGR